MSTKAKAAVLASFAADSLALGVHWIYNTNVIDKKLGRVETLVKPELASFHKGKEKGDFTHYGDQALVLLESVSEKNGFDLTHFAGRWQALFADDSGYLDGASKDVLKNFADGKSPSDAGSTSTDLGGAARIAPLLPWYTQDLDGLLAACRAQTAMTHNNPEVLESADFFARVAYLVLDGQAPLDAVAQVLGPYDAGAPFRELVESGLDSRDQDTRQAISDFGQMCETQAALPATVHLIARYESDLKTALVENVMAGGDSSARGMLAGMVLGAYNGIDAIADTWVAGLTRRDQIMALLLKVGP